MQINRDIFVEELIRRNRAGKEALFKVAAIILGLILCGLAFHYFTSIFPFFFALICILIFFMFRYSVKEYEYSFISGDVDIDMILGKRKRKTVLSCSCRDIKLMEYCGSRKVEGDFTSVIDASISVKSDNRWYFICELEDGNRTLVYFNPSKRLQDAFKQYLGPKMKLEPAEGSSK
ncbi:MAG: hypothetical protein PUB32_10210 [Clostridiales bacterium]|nr:hypothetical protein [Clostridiales bacterium]